MTCDRQRYIKLLLYKKKTSLLFDVERNLSFEKKKQKMMGIYF